MGKVFRPRIVIPESFDLCLTYEQQILYLVRWCGMLADAIGGPGSPAIEELQDAVGKINETLAQIELSLQDYYNKGEIDAKLSGYVTKVTLDTELASYETVDAANEAHNQIMDLINQRALKTDLDALEQTVNQAIGNLGDTYATKDDLQNAISGLGDMYASKSSLDALIKRVDDLESIIGDVTTQGEGIRTLLCVATPSVSGATPAGHGGGYYYGVASDRYDDNGSGDISIINSGIYHGLLMCDVYPSQSGYGYYRANPVDTGRPSVNNENVGKYHLSDPNLLAEDGQYFSGYHVVVPQWAKDKYPGLFTEDSYDLPEYKAKQKLITAVSMIDYLIYALTCAGCTGRNKDHKLFVDSEVIEGSKKPVESGAVKAYVDAEIAKLRGGN